MMTDQEFFKYSCAGSLLWRYLIRCRREAERELKEMKRESKKLEENQEQQ